MSGDDFQAWLYHQACAVGCEPPVSSLKSAEAIADAETEAAREEAARSNLADFTLYVKPDYVMKWHHRLLCSYIDKLVNGEIENLMVFMPPQHGKSEVVSRKLPAFALGKNPDLKIVAASYAAELIQSMNRDVQRTIETDKYARLFPETTLNGANVRTIARSYLRNNDVFEVVGRRGVYRCAGVGGSLTGFPADLGIIDDPYKDYLEAMSDTVRRNVWEWYTSVFLSRTHVNTRKLLTLTRWHHEDLAGALLKMEPEKWTVLSLPAIREDDKNPDDPRQIGEALWPEKFPVPLLQERKALNPHQFGALYQQNPTPREGSFFKVEKFEIVKAVPADLQYCRGWDLAGSKNGKRTAGVKIGKDAKGIYYVTNVKKGKWLPDDRDSQIKQTAALDGTSCAIHMPQDPGQAGVDQKEKFIRMLAGYKIKVEPVTGSKETRADSFAAQVNAGNVKLLESPKAQPGVPESKDADWNDDFIEELRQFPNGTYSDQVDGGADAFNELALGRNTVPAAPPQMTGNSTWAYNEHKDEEYE